MHDQPTVLDEPSPDIDTAAATRLAAEIYGVTGAAQRLRSERDGNFVLTTPDRTRLILKFSNSAEPREIIEMENAAMAHIARHQPAVPVPRLVPTRSGAQYADVTAPDGRHHAARLLTVIPGDAADNVTLKAGFAAELGRACATTAVGLRGFDHPAASRPLAWDPRYVGALRDRLASIGDAGRRDQLSRLLDVLDTLPERTANLPCQVAHGDVTLSNVLTQDGRTISGVIDFGDMHRTARAADLAIAMASLLRVFPDVPGTASAFLRGYQTVCPLVEDEVRVVGDLMTARLVASVLIGSSRTPSDPESARTVAAMIDGSWPALDALTGDGSAALTDRLLRASGLRWATPTPDTGDRLLARRRAAQGGSLVPLFYRDPLQVVRGDGPWMWTSDGVRYLDAYNNVPVVGHGHPAVAQAVGRQTAALNVNARYLHPNAVELAERLLATMPDGLDTCIFLNSGSEANDLAWRLATCHTGRGGALVTSTSYHGVSAATAAFSANTWKAGVRPGHVATMPAPHPVDGRVPDRADASAAVTLARSWLADRSLELALCLVDSLFTSGGILPASPGYMAGLVDAVRDTGGLFLADEVQAGFGRSGCGLWSFSRFGITPDFVALGKPMGNGYPIAALVTRSDIVRSFAAVDEYFSTFGGTPAAAAAALTALDIIEQENLVTRSDQYGRLLRETVAQTLADLPCQVEVRGSGLIAGIEFGSQPADLMPALVERLRREHILVGSTGPGDRTLKVRPPLIWTDEHVDIFAAGLRASVADLTGSTRRSSSDRPTEPPSVGRDV